MIALLDYGSGNLRSAERALTAAGNQVTVTSDFELCLNADGLVVPGVGAFASCMEGLIRVRGDELIRARYENNRPTLGICIGMQILFTGSDESPGVEGVGIFPDRIARLKAPVTPHMGWNRVAEPEDSRLFDGLHDAQFYFVHSFALTSRPQAPDDSASVKLATTKYGEDFIAAIEYGSISATQFHPEKSGEVGLRLLDNWSRSLS